MSATALAEQSPALRRERLPAVDLARGAAIGLMAVYHLSWDLAWFGIADLPLLTSPFWLGFRAFILSSFLFLAGVSLVLAAQGGLDRRAWLRRLGLLVAAAAAVSAASYTVFPQSFIFFGVLHCIAAASVLGLAFLRLPAAVTAVVAALCLALPALWGHPAFDQPWWWWLGLGTFEPVANDYVPLLPWFGVVLLGMAAARPALGVDALTAVARRWPPGGGVPRALAWAGRHSLAIYLIHQPVLFGLVWLAVSLAPIGGTPGAALGLAAPGTAPGEGGAPAIEAFLESCRTACTEAGGGDACAGYCGCVLADLQGAGLFAPLLAGELSAAEGEAVAGIANRCTARWGGR
jgi:uncharacterized membrane protein